MSDHLSRLSSASIAVVTFGSTPAQLDAHRRHLGVDLPLLDDADRSLYRQFGLGRGSRRQIYSLSTMLKYAGLMRSGMRLKRPEQDTLQLGADMILDPTHRLSGAFYPSKPDDRPSITELAKAVAAASTQQH